MERLGLQQTVVDEGVVRRTVARFTEAGVRLPTFAQLADPTSLAELQPALADVSPDAPHPLNLFRVHWYNDAARTGLTAVPGHLVLDERLTGVRAPILVALGGRFPMIAAHKVLAAFACLVPRLVTGQFDPTAHKAIWPSTGNYCRGGVAISRILGCRGVAVLPEGMSQERFDWLDRWVADPSDILRTPGSESNVKEIYDACAALDREPENVIFNQFCEFGNHLVHHAVTGKALDDVYRHVAASRPGLRLAAFTSATGSAGTIAAGTYLKERHGTRIVAVEALECPTLLYNGFGEHNIQGIGDKHLPLIHDVMDTDVVTAVSDEVSDSLYVLLNTDAGRTYLSERRGIDAETLDALQQLGLSGIANVVAAIKTARYYDLGPDDALITVATDSGAMYGSERDKVLRDTFGGRFDALSAAETFGRGVLGAATDHLLELSHADKQRVFNLGYFTWVEQQGVSVEEFTARRDPDWWRGLRELLPTWDRLIEELNAAVD